MKFKSNKLGHCPFCDSTDLEYGTIQLEHTMCWYEWSCNKCDNTGEEWYTVEFAGHNVNTEDGNIEITDDMLECEE